MNKTKRSIVFSVVSLVLCVAMLAGSTFAWFTDSVTSVNNIIKTGNLDLKVLWTDDLEGGNWNDAEDSEAGPVFSYDNWEPGYTSIRYVKIVNAGSLAFKYSLNLIPDGDAGILGDVIDVYYVEDASSNITKLDGLTKAGVLNDVINKNISAGGVLLPKGETKTGFYTEEIVIAIALHMHEDAGNEYQNKSVGASFAIQLLATQYDYESDDLGDGYDQGSQWPNDVVVGGSSASAPVTPVDGKVPAGGLNLVSEDGEIGATIPEGVAVVPGTTNMTLTIGSVSKSEANITLDENEAALSIDVHVSGVAENNTVPMAIYRKELLPVGLNMGNYRFYHVEDGNTVEMVLLEDGATPVHNNYEYDPATGDVVLYLASFSEVAMVAEPPKWEGNRDYSWYNNAVAPIAEGDPDYIIANADQLAAFGAIVGGMDGQTQNSFKGKTVKLVADINLGDKESENNPSIIFYPIGYYNSEGTYERTNTAITSGLRNFEGTFDGNGNTISNFYQNTWEMKGDHDWYSPEEQYYRDGMGLFGRVYGGTVKNLTVDNFSSDGEIATTGVIAAYAEGATFTNIAITNCNPRVYNIGNGGIVGCVGWYAKEAGLKTTFTNITVDNSNKISALWGSYDVACGGIVGQYYPTSGQTSAGTPKNAGIHFENCHVSAVMDVYNDVCANYQYYAYRYTGMMIGSVRENETIDGHVYPKMDGITASGCTVHFGDWNDYYYCELVANSLASYTHDHQMSRLTQVASVDVENKTVTDLDGKTTAIPASGRVNYVVVKAKDANGMWIHGDGHDYAECYHFVNGVQHFHDVADTDNPNPTETVGGVETLKEDKQLVYREFNQLFTGYGWGVTSKGLADFEGTIILDNVYEGEPVTKFESKFTGDFLYRVGNAVDSTVSVGTLFQAIDSSKYPIANSGVHVKVEAVYENQNVGGTFKANATDWTKGTIQFYGTGIVKVTIQDYIYCTPTTIILEVVDALNATGATNATSNNVVLLQDCGFSSIDVSGGHTLYGNGFTMTCGSDSAALDMGYSFVTLNNGTLDNVQIVCPNFDYAVLYKSNMTESGNRSHTDEAGKTRYYNVKSGVMVSGDSQILNSRISGARAAVNVASGNCVIDNSRIELGAVASLLVGAANSVTLRDVTLVQKPTASTYDSSKTLMGFSVLMVCNSDGNAAPVTLEGTLVQNAWVDENDSQYVPSAGKSIISEVLSNEAYTHDLDGDGTKESLNLGFAYMPESLTSKVNTTTIKDNRDNKGEVPYDYADVSILNGKTYVYSYKNTNGTADSFRTEAPYVPNKQSDIITVTYSDTADGLTTGKTFGTDGWVYELNVDLDKLSGYTLDFSKLAMNVNGVTVTDFKVNGNAKPISPVAVAAGGTTYTLTATIDGKEYTATYKVTGTETSKESPSLVASNYEAGVCVASSYGGTWSGAAPALEGVQIKYWSVAEKQYKTISLSDYTPTTAGKQNDTNTTWTYSPDNGDFTLTLTGGQVHSGNKVNAMPVVCDGKLYFVAASSNGLVNTGNSARTIPVSYSFKDNNNGDVLTFSHTWSVAENKDAQYKYSDFCNGTLTKLEEGCLVEGTLITMADGTQKPVEELKVGDMVMVFNHVSGKYEAMPLIFNTHADDTEAQNYDVLYLQFANDKEVKIVQSHGFFDTTLMQYVYINYDNFEDFIGHEFYAISEDGTGERVELTNAFIKNECVRIFCPVTYFHMNSFANGFLNTPNIPGDITGLVNYFEYDADLKYNDEAMQRDIEKYGLYTYDDFSEYISEDAYNSSPSVYLKVAVGKGMITYEQIVDIIFWLLEGSLIDN